MIDEPARAARDPRTKAISGLARPLPPVYRPPHGGAPGIIEAHSLDPVLLPRVFRFSGMLNGQGPLSWPERELVNATTSRLNQCFY